MKLAHRRAHGIVWPVLWVALVLGFAAALLLLPPRLSAAAPRDTTPGLTPDLTQVSE